MRETLALEMPISAAMCCWGAALTAQVFDGVGCGKRDLVGATLLVVPVPAAHVVYPSSAISRRITALVLGNPASRD
jgi:hypothetical protein